MRLLNPLFLGALLLGCPHARTGVVDGGLGDGGLAGVDGGADGGLDGGRCGPPFSGQGTLFAGSLDTPRRIAVSTAFVYISASGTLVAPDGQLVRVPTAGGVETPVATGLRAADAVAADSDGVFVVTGKGVERVEPDGGVTTVDSTVNSAILGDTELAISPAQVIYATGRQWLVGIARDGGPSLRLYTGDAGATVRGVALEGSTAYFLVANVPEAGLYSVPMDGSSAARLVSPAPVDGRSLSMTGEAFVWTQGQGGDGGVRWLPRDGGAPVALADGLEAPARAMAIDGFVYFKDSTQGQPENPLFLQRVSLCAPGVAVPVGPSGIGPGDLGTDGNSLFFTSAQAAPGGFVGRLP